VVADAILKIYKTLYLNHGLSDFDKMWHADAECYGDDGDKVKIETEKKEWKRKMDKKMVVDHMAYKSRLLFLYKQLYKLLNLRTHAAGRKNLQPAAELAGNICLKL